MRFRPGRSSRSAPPRPAGSDRLRGRHDDGAFGREARVSWRPSDHAGGHQAAQAHTGGVRRHRARARPRPDVHGARCLLRHVERALQLQVVTRPPQAPSDEGPASHPGPRRERRRRRHRRRLRRRLQDGVAQPPELHRALPGRGDGRGRHPPRRLHDGRKAHRRAELAALRTPRSPAHAGAPPRRRRRHRRIRQLDRRSHCRRRGSVRSELRRQHPRQRVHVRRCSHRPHLLRPRRGHR